MLNSVYHHPLYTDEEGYQITHTGLLEEETAIMPSSKLFGVFPSNKESEKAKKLIPCFFKVVR